MAQLMTSIWVSALTRQAQSAGAAAYVARRGDPDAGIVMVKLALLDGTAQVYLPARTLDGERGWRPAFGASRAPEAEADQLLHREAGYDPDCWIVEIEDRQGRHFLTEPILED